MKSIFFSLFILSPLCASLGQPHPAPEEMGKDSVFIQGQITSSNEKPSSIRFAVVDYLLGVENYEYATIDDEGNFEIKFFLRNTSQVYCSYGKKMRHNTLILSPGDSLRITVSDNKIKFFGRNASASEEYYHIRTQKEWSNYHYVLDTGYRLEPEVYLKFRKEHYQRDLELLESYCKNRDCSALFQTWYAADAKVRYFRDLMAYSWKSVDYGLGSRVRLTGERKERYNAAYLGEINLDDSTYTISKWFPFFLNGYSQKVEKRIPPEQAQKIIYITKLNFLLDIISTEVSLEINESSAYKRVLDNLLRKAHKESEPDSADLKIMWKLSEQYELPLQRAMDKWNADRWVEQINSIPHRNTRELRFLHSFIQMMDQVPNVDYIYKKIYPHIQNATYKKILAREYEKKKEEDTLIGSPREIIVMPKNYAAGANDLLANIVKNNRNKVIVIDFWATWCGPCLDDFNTMKPIKDTFPTDSISYVYLCSQSSRDLWLKQIKKYGVKGQHYFISETQYSEFQSKFGLKGFPSYIIVDAKRRIYKDINLNDIREKKRFIEKLQGIMTRDN